MIHSAHYDSPLGHITLAGEGDALLGLWLDGQTHFASTIDGLCEDGWLPVFDDAFRWLDSYFGGYVPGFNFLTSRRSVSSMRFQKSDSCSPFARCTGSVRPMTASLNLWKCVIIKS